MVGGLPFDLRQPKYNEETEEAMDEARAIMAGTLNPKRFQSARDLLEDILSEDSPDA